jgi:uncharacterized protein (TIGR02001 family)
MATHEGSVKLWVTRAFFTGILGALICVAGMLLPGRAYAADEAWTASAELTSDYILRGVSQTYTGVALQLGGNYQAANGMFIGAWASNVDPYPFGAASVELDTYAGFAWPLTEDLTTQATYTHYTYLDDPRPIHYAFDEVAVSLKYLDRAALTVSWQPNATSYSSLGLARNRSLVAYEASGRLPLPHGLALAAGVGYYDLHELFRVGYVAGSVGVVWIGRRLEVDVARYMAGRAVGRLYEEASADGSIVVSVIARF